MGIIGCSVPYFFVTNDFQSCKCYSIKERMTLMYISTQFSVLSLCSCSIVLFLNMRKTRVQKDKKHVILIVALYQAKPCVIAESFHLTLLTEHTQSDSIQAFRFSYCSVHKFLTA